MTAKEIINILGLKPHPEEGGFFIESFKSNLNVSILNHSTEKPYTRSASTAIYYLMTEGHCSPLHRVKHDEVWHFYMGSPAEMVQIDESGKLTEIRFGHAIEKGEILQAIVPAGRWEGVRIAEGGKWSLMGITVAPGFEFEDFEMGKRGDLIKQFPKHKSIIEQFTR